MVSNPSDMLSTICRLMEDQETGILNLEKEGKEIRVYFQQGLISAAASNIPFLHIGHFLCSLGYADATSVVQLLKRSRRRHIPLGKAAVDRKLFHENDLEEVLRRQIIQTLTYALDNKFAIRSFSETTSELFAPSRLDLTGLLLDLARNSIKPFRIEPFQRVALSNGKDFAGLPWYPQELSILSELRAPRTIQELAVATGLEFENINKILCVLDSLHLIKTVPDPVMQSTALQLREKFPFEALAPKISHAHLSEKLEVFQEKAPFISEQFRTLKVRVSEAALTRAMRVLVVSSPQPSDGKSLVSANLAASFSKDSGRKVVIVDCDLRNPTLHRFLGTTPEPGLLGYLESEYLQPYCFLRRCEHLYVMTAGGVAANPVELLSHERMAALIASLKIDFDTIIIDSPPFMPVSDAQILTSLADGLVLVVRCGQTTYRSIENAFRGLDTNKLVGVVLNDVQPLMFNTQYDHRYYSYKNRSNYAYSGAKPHHRLKTYIDK